MSRRESTIKALAGALQPKNLDLTEYRQQSSRERRMRVAPDVALGALAYASVDREIAGERVRGDPLPALLIRFKYVDQSSKETFQRAHLMLLRRHGWMARRPSETMFACAYAAIFEWVHDRCGKCRGARRGATRPTMCLACGQRRDEKNPAIITGQPSKDCAKCHGLGRIFPKERPPRGSLCKTCGNSGRRTFKAKERWAIVNDYLVTAQKARNQRPDGIALDTFREHWSAKYHRFIDVLRATDRTITTGVDFGVSPSDNRGIEPEPLDFLIEDNAEDETGSVPAPDEPE